MPRVDGTKQFDLRELRAPRLKQKHGHKASRFRRNLQKCGGVRGLRMPPSPSIEEVNHT